MSQVRATEAQLETAALSPKQKPQAPRPYLTASSVRFAFGISGIVGSPGAHDRCRGACTVVDGEARQDAPGSSLALMARRGEANGDYRSWSFSSWHQRRPDE
jgi:hypothetical protein